MGTYRKIKINRWMIISALFVASGLIFLWLAFLWLIQPKSVAGSNPPAVLTVIAAPSATPTQNAESLLNPTATIGYISPEGITINGFVQIMGTDGAGLRIRSGPGTSNQPIFLGLDSEVFQVKEGPKEADGFTWWFLEAPYDSSRSGWAASKYLKVVAGPQ